jgi:hypothetical protein
MISPGPLIWVTMVLLQQFSLCAFCGLPDTFSWPGAVGGAHMQTCWLHQNEPFLASSKSELPV